MPKNVSKISETFLTDTHDLYVVCETIEDFFEIYHVDLDEGDPSVGEPICKYPFSQVGGKGVTDFHVRGSSYKEKINLNTKLLIFIMHGSDLWCQKASGDLVLVSENAFNLYYLSDDKIFFMHTFPEPVRVGKEDVIHSCILMIECLFGSYKKTQVYHDHDSRAEILNYSVDNSKKRLMILTGIKNTHNKRDKFITFFDLDKSKKVFSLMVTNMEIIGRLKSNLYSFIDGHIYYNNKVIKVRYDLIEKNQGEIGQDLLFDHYADVIMLEHKSDYISSGTPLKTCMYNRLAYIIMNMNLLSTRKLLILPYLHERKIHLNHRHDADQFYTIVEYDQRTFIICLCLNDDKMYIYTETGILCDRIVYPDLRRKCGKPVGVSEDGKIMLFKKCSNSFEVNMVKITIKGPIFSLKIDIRDRIKKFLFSKSRGKDGYNANEFANKYANYKDSLKKFYESHLGGLKNASFVQFSYTLNDNGDILFRIKPKKDKITDITITEFTEANEKEGMSGCSFFFYVPNPNSSNEEFIYFDS